MLMGKGCFLQVVNCVCGCVEYTCTYLSVYMFLFLSCRCSKSTGAGLVELMSSEAVQHFLCGSTANVREEKAIYYQPGTLRKVMLLTTVCKLCYV